MLSVIIILLHSPVKDFFSVRKKKKSNMMRNSAGCQNGVFPPEWELMLHDAKLRVYLTRTWSHTPHVSSQSVEESSDTRGELCSIVYPSRGNGYRRQGCVCGCRVLRAKFFTPSCKQVQSQHCISHGSSLNILTRLRTENPPLASRA